MKSKYVLLCCLFLTACQTPGEHARMHSQQARQECEKRGFAAGTQVFDACMQDVSAALYQREYILHHGEGIRGSLGR